MSSRNLLASIFQKNKMHIKQQQKSDSRDSYLLRNHGFNHSFSSSSLFSKQTFVNQSQESLKGIQKRSMSINHLNNSTNSINIVKPKPNNSLIPLIRALHTISVKIKKWNYFFFCRVESISKQQRSRQLVQSVNENSTPSRNFDKDIEIFQSSLQNSHFAYSQHFEIQGQNQKLDQPMSSRNFSKQDTQINPNIAEITQNYNQKTQINFKKHSSWNSYSKQESSSFLINKNTYLFEEGISKLNDSVCLIQFKRINQKHLKFAFEMIKNKYFRAIKCFQKLVHFKENQNIKVIDQSFSKLKYYDKIVLKMQIFLQAFNQLLLKDIKKVFQKIKKHEQIGNLTYRVNKQYKRLQNTTTQLQQNTNISHRLKSISEQGSCISQDDTNNYTNQSISMRSSIFQDYNYQYPNQQDNSMQFTFSNNKDYQTAEGNGHKIHQKQNKRNIKIDPYHCECSKSQINCQYLNRNSAQCNYQHSRSVTNPSPLSSKKNFSIQNSQNSYQQDSINNQCHSFRTQPKNIQENHQRCHKKFISGQCQCYRCMHHFMPINPHHYFFPFDISYTMMNMNNNKNHQLFYSDPSHISQTTSNNSHIKINIKPNTSKIACIKQSSKGVNYQATTESCIQLEWNSKFKQHENMKKIKPLSPQTQTVPFPEIHDNFSSIKSIKKEHFPKNCSLKDTKQQQLQQQSRIPNKNCSLLQCEDLILSQIFKSNDNSNINSMKNSVRNSQRNAMGGIKYMKALKALNSLQNTESLIMSANQQKSKSKPKYSVTSVKSSNNDYAKQQIVKKQSPFEKISEMLMDLQKMRQKEKKMKVKSSIQRSSKNALRNKNMNSKVVSQKGCYQCEKQKIQKNQKAYTQYQSSEKKISAVQKSKQNDECLASKIWQSKDKFLFYPQKIIRTAKKPFSKKYDRIYSHLQTPQHNREKIAGFTVEDQRSNSNMSANTGSNKNRNGYPQSHIHNASSVTTARKMQMELQQIINQKNKNLSEIRQSTVQRKHTKAFH